MKIYPEFKHFIQDNALENVVCNIVSICLSLNVLKLGPLDGFKNAYMLFYLRAYQFS